MKIFGINFTTKKELKEQIVGLTREAAELYEDLKYLREDFPFDLGDIVYDVVLKDEKGQIY